MIYNSRLNEPHATPTGLVVHKTMDLHASFLHSLFYNGLRLEPIHLGKDVEFLGGTGSDRIVCLVPRTRGLLAFDAEFSHMP